MIHLKLPTSKNISYTPQQIFILFAWIAFRFVQAYTFLGKNDGYTFKTYFNNLLQFEEKCTRKSVDPTFCKKSHAEFLNLLLVPMLLMYVFIFLLQDLKTLMIPIHIIWIIDGTAALLVLIDVMIWIYADSKQKLRSVKQLESSYTTRICIPEVKHELIFYFTLTVATKTNVSLCLSHFNLNVIIYTRIRKTFTQSIC